jgi:hypothetical protein
MVVINVISGMIAVQDVGRHRNEFPELMGKPSEYMRRDGSEARRRTQSDRAQLAFWVSLRVLPLFSQNFRELRLCVSRMFIKMLIKIFSSSL